MVAQDCLLVRRRRTVLKVPVTCTPDRPRAPLLPEEPEFRQQSGVLLGLLWGGLRSLFML